MEGDRAELQQIFDSQVKRICELIDKQLQRMALKMPEKQIVSGVLIFNFLKFFF